MTFTPKAIKAAKAIDFAKESRDLKQALADNAYPAADGSADIDNHAIPIIEATLRNVAERFLTAALAVDGVALVPVEPSAEMLCAAVPFPLLLVKERNDPQYTKNMEAACLVERAVARQVYRTMLAAASDREERR